MITQKELKKWLDYDPVTGEFTWLPGIDRNKPRKGKAGYISIYVNGANYLAHRLAFLWMNGSWPTGHVDHKNMVRSDNRWANLRDVSHGANLANCRAHSNNKGSGERGVYKQRSVYTVQLQRDRKLHYFGRFSTLDAAIVARDAAFKKLWPELH